MIEPGVFYKKLKTHGVGIFTGVPDSLLKPLSVFLDENCPTAKHVVAANEGNAIAIASGYYLSTEKIGAVYMQNSGLGNCINPLTSLVDPEVYSIPMLLIIGWRGEPNIKDEPQHIKQGRITQGQLDLLEIPYWILQPNSDLDKIFKKAFSAIKKNNSPAALLVRKGTFISRKGAPKSKFHMNIKREQALHTILDLANPEDLVVSTTGKTSRELFELRRLRGESQRDFLTVGSMGHTASIALGVALGVPSRLVLCIDGDGSTLMHMGALPIIGSLKPINLIHFILNNSAYESVGGQPTVAGSINFEAISKSCGYMNYSLAYDIESLKIAWMRSKQSNGPHMIEVQIATGSRKDLGRPTTTPEENKKTFMEAIRG